jgi:ABC-2 type transport system ATP-binding protein
VLGYVPWERKKAFKMQFAIVMGQKNQLWWDLPANESLYLNKCIYEIDDRAYQATLAELTELLDVKDLLSVQVRRLSLGERMKMELIAALLHKPKLIFLDEPTIGLDILSQKKIRDFFKYYNQEQKATVILTSHYMADVEDLCKRAIIINQGRIVFDGDLYRVNELFEQSKVIKLQLSKPVTRETLAVFGVIKEHSDVAATLEVSRLDLKERSKAILDQLPVVDFNIEDIPVEEGIALLYQRQEAVDAEV